MDKELRDEKEKWEEKGKRKEKMIEVMVLREKIGKYGVEIDIVRESELENKRKKRIEKVDKEKIDDGML